MNCSDYIEWKTIKTNMCSGAIPAVCYMCPQVGEGSGSTGGDSSQWSRYPALQDVSMANFSFNTVQSVNGGALTLRSTTGNLYLSAGAEIIPDKTINFNNINNAINIHDVAASSTTGIIINTLTGTVNSYGIIINTLNSTINESDGIIINSVNSSQRAYGININTINGATIGTGINMANVSSDRSTYGIQLSDIFTSGNYVAGISLTGISNVSGNATVTAISVSNVQGNNSSDDTTGIKLQTLSSTQGPIKGIYINDVSTANSDAIGIDINNINVTAGRADCIGVKIDNINSEMGAVALKIGSNITARDTEVFCKAIEQIGIDHPNIYNELQSRVVIGTGTPGNSIPIDSPYGSLLINGSIKYTANHFPGTSGIWDISRNTGNLYTFATLDNQFVIMLPTDPENGTFFKFMNINGSITKIDGNGRDINNLLALDWKPSRPYTVGDIWYSSDLEQWIAGVEM